MLRLYQEQNVSTTDENCSICLENLNSNPTHELNECKHIFHSSCLITWLRVNAGCPMCRNVTKSRPEGTILRHILSFCKSKKNTSTKLKKMYSKYIKLKDTFNNKKKEQKEFKKCNDNIFKKYRKINREVWNTRIAFLKMKKEISSLPIESINKK